MLGWLAGELGVGTMTEVAARCRRDHLSSMSFAVRRLRGRSDQPLQGNSQVIKALAYAFPGGGYSMVGIGYFFGVGRSTVSRAVNKFEK